MRNLLKNIVYPIVPLRLRYSPEFWGAYRFAKRSQSLGKQELINYQWLRLQETIKLAYGNSAYYRGVFDRLGMTPCDIREADDYRKLPILTKSELRENLDAMLTMPKRDLEYFTTGGSTGVPIGLFLERRYAHITRE
jgi:phenylacetate-CoA ligase